MHLYRFRVLVDDQVEAFRDIEVMAHATFFDLHRAILDAFAFQGQEMASFYVCDDDWQRGEEIPLMDMGMLDDGSTPTTMEQVMIGDHVESEDQKFTYVYDFLNMWCFYVELVQTTESDQGPEFAQVVFSHGEAPKEDSRNAGFDLEELASTEGFTEPDGAEDAEDLDPDTLEDKAN